MAKRFVDTYLHRKKWFRSLRWQLKEAWRYLCAECDTIGIWEIDMDLLNLTINSGEAPVTLEEMQSAFGGRLQVFDEDKLLLTGFVAFQYGDEAGKLSSKNKFHLSIVKKLKARGLPVPEFKTQEDGGAYGVDTLSTGQGSTQGIRQGQGQGISNGKGNGESEGKIDSDSEDFVMEAEFYFLARRKYASNLTEFNKTMGPQRLEMLNRIGGRTFLFELEDNDFGVKRLARLLGSEYMKSGQRFLSKTGTETNQ